MSADLLLITEAPPGERAEDDDFPVRPLRSGDEVRNAYEASARGRRASVWIAECAGQLRPLAGSAPLLRADNRLLLLTEAKRAQRDFLHVMFRVVVAPRPGTSFLPREELMDVLPAPNRDELFITGFVDLCDEVVVLYRGNLEPVVVPFEFFRHRSTDDPDFHDFEVIDYGHGVRFGEYEAATDFVLYMHDPVYRRRAKARELRHDPSFGACVRRLRLYNVVARDDFPGVSEKEIARIERGEIQKPHRRTVEAIAKRLGVKPSEITSY